MTHNDRSLSEIISLILLAFLVVVIALFITMALTGVLDRMLQKPALITVTAAPYDTSSGTIIRLHHEQGEKVILKGTSQTTGNSIIEVLLVTPSGASHSLLPAAGGITTDSWSPGDSLYIVPSGSTFEYTDTPPATGDLTETGTYILRITDTKANVLLHTVDVTVS